MRIDSNQPIADQIVTDRSTANTGKTAQGGDAPAAEGASFSADSAGVAGLVARALQTPEVRQDRVDSLRQAINNGSYQVDPGQIADAMLGKCAG